MSRDETGQGHCFRCRSRKEIDGATQTRLRNGKMAVTGTCVTCGTRIFRLLREQREASSAGEAGDTCGA